MLRYLSLKDLGRARIAGMLNEEKQVQAIAFFIVSRLNRDDSLHDSQLWKATKGSLMQVMLQLT